MWFDSRRRSWSYPGLAVAVAKSDRMVFEAAYGLADVGQVEEIMAATAAYGPLAKQFTAALVLVAAADGKLSPTCEALTCRQLFLGSPGQPATASRGTLHFREKYWPS